MAQKQAPETTHGAVRAVINDNATDAETRISQLEVEITVKTTSDLGTPVGGFYELSNDGKYRFACGLTLDYPIKLTKQDGNYTFEGVNINCLLSYTGVESMIQTTATGIVLSVNSLVLNTPNTEAITFSNGNSLLMTNISLGFGCQKVATVTDTAFLTCDGFAMVGCTDGVTCTNVDSLSITNTQWTSGAGASGKAFSINGTGSQAKFSILNYVAESTESMILINNNYAGRVVISSGIYTDNGGVFFDATGRDKTHPSVSMSGVVPLANSGVSAFSHSTGGTTTDIINQNEAVKVNAVWSNGTGERVGINTDGTWTYTGLETKSLTVNCAIGVDPGANNQTLTAMIYKNGVLEADSTHEVIVNRGGQIIIFYVVTNAETNDYIEVFIANNSSDADIDILNSSLKIG